MIARLIGALAVTLTVLAHRLGEHVYLSTACLHGQCSYCQSHAGQSGQKTPGVCKFCRARCACRSCRQPRP